VNLPFDTIASEEVVISTRETAVSHAVSGKQRAPLPKAYCSIVQRKWEIVLKE
jgi:hypothetical protein